MSHDSILTKFSVGNFWKGFWKYLSRRKFFFVLRFVMKIYCFRYIVMQSEKKIETKTMRELLRKEQEGQVHVSLKKNDYFFYFLLLKVKFRQSCSKITDLLWLVAMLLPFERFFSALIPFLQSLRNTTTPWNKLNGKVSFLSYHIFLKLQRRWRNYFVTLIIVCDTVFSSGIRRLINNFFASDVSINWQVEGLIIFFHFYVSQSCCSCWK